MPIYEAEVYVDMHVYISVEACNMEDAERFAIADAQNAIGMLGSYSGNEIEALSIYEVKADNSNCEE